jgi:hypothetical protein
VGERDLAGTQCQGKLDVVVVVDCMSLMPSTMWSETPSENPDASHDRPRQFGAAIHCVGVAK